jgi:hypothetical protein
MDKNMDVKDLFKKFKEGSKKKDARKGGSLNAFFEKNPIMKYLLPAIFVLIAVIVAVIIIFQGINTDTDVDENITAAGQAVVILPQEERTEPETVADGADPFSEDVLANAKVTGILYNSDGYRTAILQSRYGAYTVQVGDYVGGSDWYVVAIDDSSVTVSLDEKTRVIEFKN